MLRRTLLTVAVFAFAGPAPAQLSLTQVGNGFNQPLFVTSAPGDVDPNRLAAGAQSFTAALADAADQPRVGEEPAFAFEAADVVHLVEEDERQHGPDAGHGPQPVERLRVVDLGGPDQVRFEAFDLLTECRDDGQVGGEHRAGAPVGKDAQVQAGAVGGIAELLGGRGGVDSWLAIDRPRRLPRRPGHGFGGGVGFVRAGA
jgi:hypothetical protein